MAVAAYSSVLALSRVVDNMRHPAHLRLFPDLTQIIDDLRQNLCFLQELFEVHSSKITKDVLERVVRRIPRVARDAEISIDNFVVDQLQRELEDLQHDDDDAEGGCRSIESFHGEITQVVQEIAQINGALQTLTTTAQQDQEQPRKSDDRPLTRSGGEKGKTVGFDDQVGQVLEKLAGNQANLVIIPIIGMGGIGKTTLASSVFYHPYNSGRFSVRIWLTISQDYSVEKVLEELLRNSVLMNMKDEGQSEAALITQLYQKLYGQRYLIVFDDVWSSEAWDDLRRGFPDNGNGSRVVVTTRLSEIATSLGSQNTTHSVKFLDEDKSWDLFSEKAFERGVRPLELEEIGREISKRCRGLPLMLVVVGGLLANSDMTVQHWRDVAENMNSVVSSANEEYCSRILWLSYKHLPIHLKACFLHTRYYEEDSRIWVSGLVRGWVAHGVVKPMSGKSLEEAARKYLEDLVGRNIIFVRERGRNGNIKFCGVHDLLRDLSFKEYDEEQLMNLPKIATLEFNYISKPCVICDDKKQPVTTVFTDGQMPVCSSCWSISPYAGSRSVLAVEHDSRRMQLLTTCRFIGLYQLIGAAVLNTIRLIWNLEFLFIMGADLVLPKELWEMPRLRYVSVLSFTLPDPGKNVVVLENLQKLTKVSQFKFTEETVRRIPNLRRLGVAYDLQSRSDWPRLYLQNLALLEKLERLDVTCSGASIDIEKYNFFPCSLKELILEGCEIVGWDSMTIIGSLPNLQLLKLCKDSVLGDEWNPIEGEFLKLKVLSLSKLDLARWSAEETPFPALEDLRLISMGHLEAVPQEFGGLDNLKSITVEECRDCVVESLRVIVEEQQSNGNEELVVKVNGRDYEIKRNIT